MEVPASIPAKEYTLPSGHRTYIFVLLFLLDFFDMVDRYMVSSILPAIQAEWGLTDTQGGLLISTVYWGIVLLTVPISILVDRWSRRKTISIMSTIWGLASMACAVVANFGQLFTARSILGVGQAGYGPGGSAMIAGIYPTEKRARMLGIWTASEPLGAAVAIALGGIIAMHLGWRAAFGLTALPGIIVAILFFFIKDYKTVDLVKTVDEGKGKSSKVKMKVSDTAKEFLHTPTLIFTYLGFAWLPTYFHRMANIPIDQAGLKASVIMLMAIIGAPLGGYLADLWVKKKANARLILASITTIVSALLIFAAFFLFDGDIQYAVLLLLGIMITAFVPAAIVVTQEVIHPGLRAMSYAVAIVFMNLLGASAGPLVIGAISDAAGIQTAMLVLPVFLAASAALFFIGSFFFIRDLNKVEKIRLEMES